jgi:eukaryotic-like serine/threonine-protein kinase
MDMHDAYRNLLLGILALKRGLIRQDVLVSSLKSWVLEKEKPFDAILAAEGKLVDEQLYSLQTECSQHLQANGQDVRKSLASVGTVAVARTELEGLADGELMNALAFLNGTADSHDDGLATQMVTLDQAPSATAGAPGGLETQEFSSGPSTMASTPGADAEPSATLAHGAGMPTLPVDQPGETLNATQQWDARSPNSPATLPVGHDPTAATQAFGPGERGASGRPAAAGDGSDHSSHTGSRYRIIRPHARGGLGEVFVAHDEELSREVALKEIQGRHADRSESRMRFLLEAEVTGGLEHPGIVPVYGLGQYPDGRPYYAMRFIRGDSLEKAIDCFHTSDRSPRDPAEREFELRQLLGRFVDVCNAISYAHSRGVLHRDIKPANVMLGSFGETLVVDWGLAKPLYRTDPALESNVGPLRPMSASGKSETLMGSAVGTPQFMSPEQAEGQLDVLGPPSDVYSLGATLYYLLTGKAAFEDRNLASLFKKLKQGEFPRPHQINRKVPLALEAICMKAMAVRIEGRYHSARELADDVELWLADEPVSVYREPPSTRMLRWAKRHKTLVSSAAALLLTGIVGLAVGTVLIKREQARTESNFQMARRAVDQMLTELGQVELADVPQMEPVRKKMLGDSLAFYQEFLAQRGKDLSIRQETGRASIRLGDILEMLGDYEGAERAYDGATALLGPLIIKYPKVVTYQRDLATAQHNRGILEKQEFQFEAAELDLGRARQIRKQLAIANPGLPEYQLDAQDSVYQLGAVLAKLSGRDQEAEQAYREVVAAERRLSSEHPTSMDMKRKLARYLNNLGILLTGSDPVAAEDVFIEAVAIEQPLADKSPTVAGLQWELARSTNNLGTTLESRKHDEEAEAAYRKAYDRVKKLADNYPSVPDYRYELAGTAANLGQVLCNQKKNEEAETMLREAVALQSSLAEGFPRRPDYPQKLVEARRKLGMLLARTGRLDEAEAEFRAAIKSQAKLSTAYSKVPEYESAYARTLDNLAIVLHAQKRTAEARTFVEQAIVHQQNALQSSSHRLRYTDQLLKDYDYLAETLASTSDHSAAVKAAQDVTRLLPSEYGSHYRAAKLMSLASVWVQKESELRPDERNQRSQLYANQALEELRKSVKLGFRNLRELDRHDFDSIRERPDFTKLKQEVESKLKPPPVG